MAHDDIAELQTLLRREGSGSRPWSSSRCSALAPRWLPEFIDQLGKLRIEHGFLLVADEVATGFGRTGDFFASQRWPAPRTCW